MAGNNLVYMILDSCRFDSFMKAKKPNFDRLGEAQQRFSFASWTAPSHFSLLMGQVPHSSPRRVFASEVYKEQFAQWVDRLGVPDLSFKTFVPELCLALVAKKHGYRTFARVSMPVLNPYSGLTRGFDDYKLMSNHNDFAGMVEEMEFPRSERRFYFLNLGETHYPYMLDDKSLPIISGVHGVARGMDDLLARTSDLPSSEPEFFAHETMQFLHDQQVRCVEYVDGVFGALLDKCPKGTHFVIAGDHGELFGEDDYFGHGPVMHRKCFEVPFLDARRPA
ncbi:MAG: metalloenzyme [Proteobacteria bacterium]|nr:metalloenzyme [Pseudomonadota bacterium]